MKTLKTFSLFLFLMCCTFYSNAQFLCGVDAEFSYSLNPNMVPTFHDTSTVSANWQITSYYWTFGDGTTSTLQNPTHVYTSSGTYRVCEYVTAQGMGVTCTDSFCRNITVNNGTTCGNIQANFNVSGSGSTVVLQSTSSGTFSGSLYEWWMDGSPITNPNPNTAYTLSNVASGHHTFCLYVYANNTTFCDSICHGFTVTGSNPCPGLTADWMHVMLSNDSVRFETRDTNTTANHYWNFGDGTTGSGFSVTHAYGSPGTYRVCSYVYITNTNCVDSFCHYITVGSSPCLGLNANWTQTYQPNNAVQFIPGNNTNNVIHHWTFGDGTVSTNVDPLHCYQTAGLYTVCHKVSIPGTTCADTSCHAIQANACNSSPCTGFGVSLGWGPNPALGGFNVEANVTSLSVPVQYSWSTGDTGRVIRVLQPGVYCVTVVSANGCSATACDSVGGNNACHLNVTIGSTNSGGVYVLEAHATGGTGALTYYWNNGTSTSHILTVTAPGTYCVVVYDANQCVADACFTVPGTPGTDTICGVVFEDTNGNGVLDSGEHGIPGAEVHIGNHIAFADSFGHYSLAVPSGNYSITYCAPPGYGYTIPISPTLNGGLNCNGYYQIQISGNGMHCGFDFGVQHNSVSLCGTVYLDADNDQMQDIGENGIGNVHIEVVSSTGHVYHAYTNQHGEYCVMVPIGTYTIHAASNTFNTCPITPQSISVTASIAGQTLGGNDFAAYCQPGLCNLSINITPHTTVTAGFPAWYDIQVCNVGSSVASGDVNMFYDAALTFDHASPAQTSHNASTRTITWSVNNLLPGHCRYFWVYLDADTLVTIGQHVFTLVNITPNGSCNDVNMVNNVDTVHQEATASWDPNNKLAYTTNHETSPSYQWVSSIDANQRLEYVINFQNLGNAPAVNVVVKDVISSDLEISSFELLGTSHAGVVTSNGNALNFKFSNIMLAAASVDEPNSHGWVKFAINSVNGLTGGHVISDEADIYFDYNQPVTTNDAAVIMLDATGIDEVVSNVTVVIAPNPMNQFAEIRINNAKDDNFRFRVTDLTGRVVAEKLSNGNAMQFERNTLAAGLYTYQIIQSDRVVAKGKLVMQ